jgi:hypothetical protein
MARGGKRRGAGRKPAGKVAMLVRVEPTVRKRLERDAKRSGRSLSREAELTLEDAFREAEPTTAETHALCYLIRQIVEVARNLERTAGPEFGWRDNRFDFEAFKYAVIEVLDRLAPAGEVDAASRYKRARSSEDLGLLVSAIVLSYLTADSKQLRDLANLAGLPTGHRFYAYPQAARDLSVNNANQEGGK